MRDREMAVRGRTGLQGRMREQSPAPDRGSRARGPKESRVAKTFNPFSISGASHMSEAGLCRAAGRTQAQPRQAAGASLASTGHKGSHGRRFCALVET